MSIQRAAPINELLAKLIFLIVPTAFVGYFLLYNANIYYAILQNDAVRQAAYLLGGMALSAIFYAFRIRFLPTFIALILVLWFLGKGIDNLATGEFDAFFLAAQYRVFAILFAAGWLIGWGFLRIRFFSIIVATLLLAGCVLVIAKQQSSAVGTLLWTFVPIAIYAVYIIFAAEQIYSYGDKSRRFWWFLSWRLGGFLALSLLLMAGVVYGMRKEIKETVANYGGGGKEGANSMLKEGKDGNFDLKDYSRLQSSLSRNNELLFIAHIDNFFEGTDVPNPLYLTAFYYTKFDTATETFEKDSSINIPRNDLFEPNPAAIPLFATRSNETVLKNSGTELLQRDVNVEIYSRKLSPGTYLAPHTGYFVQPITVDKDFRDSFKYAYRAKSVVSELNSAYFVYNARDKNVQAFQEQRFELLRTANDYANADPRFMRYYTEMPADQKFQNISRLAHEVTRNARTTVDKVIAIRDYFLSKDSAGQALFKYTDNPGVPDIPSASKLQYFLFENRKGYCAYFAGATLFMLRSLGVPSRIAVGFLTVDRSDKNKGWYWYYADQAHAWVQVYFPGYGWLDFDTTIGNEEAQESPKPDGTPPMQPPRAWLAADGVVQKVDTAAKTMDLSVGHFVFKDKEYTLSTAAPLVLDMRIATVRKDSADVPLYTVQPGDSATAVSYADAFKNLPVGAREEAAAVFKRLPAPAPIDEVYIRNKKEEKKAAPPKVTPREKAFDWQLALRTGLISLGALILLLFLLPIIIFNYYRLRYQLATGAQQVFWTYRAANFYLHQLGFVRGAYTPLQFARQVVDPALGAHFSGFMQHYLKLKYGAGQLGEKEKNAAVAFLPQLIKAARQRMKWHQRLLAFLQPWRSFAYYMKPTGNPGPEGAA